MAFNLTATASAATLPVLNSCNSLKVIKHTPTTFKQNFNEHRSSSNKNNLLETTNGYDRETISKQSNKILNLEEQFKAACDVIQNLPKNGPFQPSNELLLKFYGYFKQANQGPCNTPKPSIFKVVERAKWDAWNSVRNLSKSEAMQGYIDEIKNIIETMPHNQFVQKLCQVIGPFYEYTNDNHRIKEKHSTQSNNFEDEVSSDEELAASNDIKMNYSDEYNHINGHSANGSYIATKSVLSSSSTTSLVFNSNFTNGNGINVDLNPETNSIEAIQSDDEEDFCDTTSELINEQLPNKYLNDQNESKLKESDNCILASNGINYEEIKSEICLNERRKSNDFSSLVHKYGGEMNSPPSSSNQQPYGNNQSNQSVRQSRPGSSASFNGRQISLNQSGSGGGGYPPNESFLNPNYIAQDTNRQILLILLRLQQDTNNVITRLSYLEATVMSLTMNRIENSIQMNNQVSASAFSLVNNSPQNRNINETRKRSTLFVSLYNWFINIDWKTVSIALLWPFVIRLVFYLFRKIRLVVKFKRIRQEFGPKF